MAGEQHPILQPGFLNNHPLFAQNQTKDLGEMAEKGVKEILDKKQVEYLKEKGGELAIFYKNYSLFIGLKMRIVNIDISNAGTGPGGSSFFNFIDCSTVAVGERCGFIIKESSFEDDVFNLEKITQPSIQLVGPTNYFKNSRFGYRLVFESRFYQFSKLSSLPGSQVGPFIQNIIQQGKLSGSQWLFTPVFFYSFLREKNSDVSAGMGVGLGYFEMSGFFQNGNISTGDSKTLNNPPNLTNFDIDGLIFNIDIFFSFITPFGLRFEIELNKGDVFHQRNKKNSQLDIVTISDFRFGFDFVYTF